MSNFSSADTEKLSQLLGKELDAYEQIRKLTETQTELLTRDDIDAFDSSLDKRAKLIEKIKGLHQESDPLMQSCVSLSADGKSSNEEIDNLTKKIREVLEICNDLNEKNITIMNEKTEEQTKKIDEQSAKRKGIGGYAQSVPNTPEIFDKKS